MSVYVSIYGLADPSTQQLRYVGKTEATLERRWRIHRNAARSGKHWFVCRWWRKVEAAGLQPEIFEIERVLKNEWQEAERFWIAYFKYLGCRLTNATPGGDGTDGYAWTDVQKARQSDAIKASPAAVNSLAFARQRIKQLAVAGKLKGTRPRSKEWSEKIERSKAASRKAGLHKKKGPLSAEARERVRQGARQSHARPDYRAKMSASKMGQRRSPEAEAARVASWKKSLETKKAAGLGRYSPEGRAKILAAQKRRRDRERNAATAAQQGATL